MGGNQIEITSALDLLWAQVNNSRAHFPFITKENIGQQRLRTPDWYEAQGYSIVFDFGKPITHEMRIWNNGLAAWLNENALVRLCVTLESFGVIPQEGKGQIDLEADGGKEINLVRRLRNHIVHESGRYKPNNSEHRKTAGIMNDLLNVDMSNRTDWDTSINTVLLPLFLKCRSYAQRIVDGDTSQPKLDEGE